MCKPFFFAHSRAGARRSSERTSGNRIQAASCTACPSTDVRECGAADTGCQLSWTGPLNCPTKEEFQQLGQLSWTGPLNCPSCWNSSFVGNTYVPRAGSQTTKMGQACP